MPENTAVCRAPAAQAMDFRICICANLARLTCLPGGRWVHTQPGCWYTVCTVTLVHPSMPCTHRPYRWCTVAHAHPCLPLVQVRRGFNPPVVEPRAGRSFKGHFSLRVGHLARRCAAPHASPAPPPARPSLPHRLAACTGVWRSTCPCCRRCFEAIQRQPRRLCESLIPPRSP